jgi:hypothetical protein
MCKKNVPSHLIQPVSCDSGKILLTTALIGVKVPCPLSKKKTAYYCTNWSEGVLPFSQSPWKSCRLQIAAVSDLRKATWGSKKNDSNAT